MTQKWIWDFNLDDTNIWETQKFIFIIKNFIIILKATLCRKKEIIKTKASMHIYVFFISEDNLSI